jgi:hypothetical protein
MASHSLLGADIDRRTPTVVFGFFVTLQMLWVNFWNSSWSSRGGFKLSKVWNPQLSKVWNPKQFELPRLGNPTSRIMTKLASGA